MFNPLSLFCFVIDTRLRKMFGKGSGAATGRCLSNHLKYSKPNDIRRSVDVENLTASVIPPIVLKAAQCFHFP